MISPWKLIFATRFLYFSLRLKIFSRCRAQAIYKLNFVPNLYETIMSTHCMLLLSRGKNQNKRMQFCFCILLLMIFVYIFFCFIYFGVCSFCSILICSVPFFRPPFSVYFSLLPLFLSLFFFEFGHLDLSAQWQLSLWIPTCISPWLCSSRSCKISPLTEQKELQFLIQIEKN